MHAASNQFHAGIHALEAAGGGHLAQGGWAGEKPWLAADRTAAVLDRLLVDWVADGLGRWVGR